MNKLVKIMTGKNQVRISGRERNILLLAGLVAIVFAASNGFPAVRALYQAREQNIENVQLDISREQRLIENTAQWRERRVEVEERRMELEAQIFDGNTIPIVEANIQRALALHARDSDLSVSSTRLAERLVTDGWLLISQEMSFRTDNASNTISFLEKLENSAPRLRVTDFSINHNRTQFNGSITVVGFARSEGLITETATR